MSALTPADSPAPASRSGRPARRAHFATTHWSVVLAAGRTDSLGVQRALASLCQTYWYPLYAFVRRQGRSPHDAEDLTQGFFAQLLELNSIAGLSPAKGRFRSFLLAAMQHYLANARIFAHAQKRDSRRLITLDSDSAEDRYRRETVDHVTPESIFERQWALTLLHTVADRLRDEYARDGRVALFQQLSFCLAGERSAIPYAKLAPQTGLSEGALRVAVHRLRQRFRQLLEDEIAHTVAAPGEVPEELHHLQRVLGS